MSNSWNQIGDNIYGQIEGGYFGSSVALNNDGSFLAVGSPPEKWACNIPILTASVKAFFHISVLTSLDFISS